MCKGNKIAGFNNIAILIIYIGDYREALVIIRLGDLLIFRKFHTVKKQGQSYPQFAISGTVLAIILTIKRDIFS